MADSYPNVTPTGAPATGGRRDPSGAPPSLQRWRVAQGAAAKLMRRVKFHYTPKLASRLSMVEIEIGILSRQCLDRRNANLELLESEVAVWQPVRNEEKRSIEWNFTRQDADKELGHLYVSKLTC